MKKLLVLFILAFLAGCSSNSPTVPKEGIKKIRIIQTSNGLAKREVATVSNPATDTIHLGNIYKDVPFTFILQNAGNAVINNLIVKAANPLLQVRRDTLGELALPDQQTIVPILELLVRSAGTSPWTNELIPDADTGYGAGSLSFYDGDSLISTYTVDFNVKMVKLTIQYYTDWDTTLQKYTDAGFVFTNKGNCEAYVNVCITYVPSSVFDTIPIAGQLNVDNSAVCSSSTAYMTLNSQTLRSNCQFDDESLYLKYTQDNPVIDSI